MENDAGGMAVARTHAADAMAEIHAVDAACSLHGAMANRENDAVALAERYN